MVTADQPPRPDPASLLDQIERLNGFGCFVLYPESGGAYWSDGLYRLLGLPRRGAGESAPASYVDVFYSRVHPDDLPRVRDGHARLASEGIIVDTTYRIVRPDGTTLLVRASGAAHRRDDGVVGRVVGALHDVTRISFTENRLAEDALLTEVQFAAGVGIYVYDVATQRLEWSRTLYDILGVDPSVTPTGELAVELTHPEDRPLQFEWGTGIGRGESMPPVITRIMRPDGGLRHIESRARRIDSAAGQRIVGVTIDVTARVELEERLREAAKMEAVGALAAGVAHDFNNYLTVMALEVDAMVGASAERTRAAIGALRDTIERCASLTGELLAFARKRASSSTSVDLGALVESTAGLFGRAAGPALALELRLPERPIHVIGDQAQLGTVLVNLLLNARDALPPGGRVTVTVDERRLDERDPTLEPGAGAGRHARVMVTDDGAGITPEDLPRIFEPYFSTTAMLARIERAAPGRPLVHKPFDRDDLLRVLSAVMAEGGGTRPA